MIKNVVVVFWCWTYLVVTLLPSSSPQASLPHDSIATYTAELPSDVAPLVNEALEAEWRPRRWREKCQVEETPPCPPSKFREPNGECNNIRHGKWGSRGEVLLRMKEADYADGFQAPRQPHTPHSLTSPLAVAATLQASPPRSHESVTALLGAWSEFLLHDLVGTGHPGGGDCCGDEASHGECYGRLGGGQCREYVRSLPGKDREQCDYSKREQLNLATSYLDASALYGSTSMQSSVLRTYSGGLMNASVCAQCQRNALYSALLREHNRVVGVLGELNRHWSDETLFLEARRIVAAEIQHITYNEWLPNVLGQETIVNADLQLKSHGRSAKYSSSLRAGVFNEVATTALPALLSMIPNSLMNETAETFAEMIDLLISRPAQVPSMHMAVSLRSDWDTASLYVHMGRDHGIPAYPVYLQLCHNETSSKFTNNITFEDLKSIGYSNEYIKALKYLYSDMKDVDLLVGAILEKPLPGAIVGPTFSCLMKHQFLLLKQSDRFWYENDLPPSSLTTEQLSEIKKITMAGLLCANTDDLDKIQPKAFVQEDPYLNARLSCNQHPLPELTAWLEMDHMTDISEDLLMDALAKAEQEVLERRKMEYQVWSNFGGLDPKSPAGTAASFSKANKQALKLANSSLLFEFASNEIINSLMNRRRKRQVFDNTDISSIFRDELSDGLQNVDIASLIPNTAFQDEADECVENTSCDPTSPFRTFSGRCNNLRNPDLGKSLTTFSRLLPSVYDDGISKPRSIGVSGTQLPSPRVVSTIIHPDISNLHKRYPLMLMQFAQFLDHDLTMTPIHKGFHESIPDCRRCDSPRTVHPECDPFPVPPGDHYYPEVNITSGKRLCFPFMRSLPGQRQLGSREQVNQNSAYLDASQVYGENACVARILRGFRGTMNSTRHPFKGKDLLPQSDSHPECKAKSGYCFIAGDGRASEQPGLTTIHTLFMREHNKLVNGLRRINTHWSEEVLFEHARRILIAEFQHMTYNEFLPRLLSWNAVNLYGLKLLPQGYYKEYNPTCNPAIMNEFACAAFRIGHSLLRPHIPRMSQQYQLIDPPILLRDGFFKTDMLMQVGMIDEISRGLVSTPMENLDQFVTGEVTNHLFEDRKIPFSGVDLIALNIQRGRDHGIPSYNNYRALCNLKRATTFEDLGREIAPEVIARLKRTYATVDDIDLFPGGLSERPLQGGLVGPTFACIIALQFRQLRKCDRFWYENEDPAVKFTERQLQEIRKSTLAKVICDNMDSPSDMQRAAFDLPSNFLNPRVPCNSLPKIDLSAWKEASSEGCVIGDHHIQVGESAFPSPCTSCICTDEGGQCASLKVTDCNQLLREWSKDAVLRDEVCAAQCGYLLRTGRAQPPIHTGLRPPPPGTNRPQQRPRLQPRNVRIPDFEFPDLSGFVL